MKRADQVSENQWRREHGHSHRRLHLNSCVQNSERNMQKSAKEIIMVPETKLIRSLKDQSLITLTK